MENNKYAGTMFEHFDSILTDRMLAADSLVKKIEYLQEHVDQDTLNECSDMVRELDQRLVERCATPRLHLVHENCSNAFEQFRSFLFHIKHVFREIYTSWVSGVIGHTPVFSECVLEIDNRISQDERFKTLLRNTNM